MIKVTTPQLGDTVYIVKLDGSYRAGTVADIDGDMVYCKESYHRGWQAPLDGPPGAMKGWSLEMPINTNDSP